MAKSHSEEEDLGDQIEGQQEPSDEGSSDEASSSDEDSDGGGLLDTMAAEGSEEESSDDEEDGEDGHGNRQSRDSTIHYFPQFCQLPIELRHRVWEFFCPELICRYRVLDFSISYGTARHPDSATMNVWTVRDGLALEEQTKTLRTVFAVHRESRAMAAKAFPHSLSMDAGAGDAIVAYNRDSDVVLVNGLSHSSGIHVFHLPDFAGEIKNLALGGWESIEQIDGADVSKLLDKFDRLESLFMCMPDRHAQKAGFSWCASELINRYEVETYEREPGFGENLRFLYCWPDLQNHPDFAKYQIPRDQWDNLPSPLDVTLQQKGVKAWPMVVFEFERGLRRFEMLLTLGVGPGDSDSEDESGLEDGDDESGTDLDEYESDGIDDAAIVETYESSDEEGISLDGGSPGPSRHVGSDGGEAGQFSSPEPDPEPETAPRGRKRRVVSDSDDESDDAVQPSNKRARTDRVVSSDEEDDDEPAVTRSTRVTVLDDDDEEEEEPVVTRSTRVTAIDDDDESDDGAPRQRTAADTDESDASSDESEDESDEEDAPPRPLSLAERLRLHREENPINDSGDEHDSDQDDESSRTADQESDDERNPYMDGMADESEDEGVNYYEDD